MHCACQRLQCERACAVVERQVVERQVDAARSAVLQLDLSRELARCLHRFEIRIEQQRLQIALVRAGKFETREPQSQRAQRLFVLEVENYTAARLRDLRVVDGETLDRQLASGAECAGRTRTQRVCAEIHKDRLRVCLTLRGAHRHVELPVVAPLASSSLQARAQLVGREAAALVVERDVDEGSIERPRFAAQRSAERHFAAAELDSLGCDFERSVAAAVHEPGGERLRADDRQVPRDARPLARDGASGKLQARAVDSNVA